jgi:hypothetical protein
VVIGASAAAKILGLDKKFLTEQIKVKRLGIVDVFEGLLFLLSVPKAVSSLLVITNFSKSFRKILLCFPSLIDFKPG